MLNEFKKRCRVINHIREIELGQEYAKQKQTPKNKDLNTWVDNWDVLSHGWSASYAIDKGGWPVQEHQEIVLGTQVARLLV